MTPDEAEDAVKRFMARTMHGAEEMNLRIAPWRTREYENAFIFSLSVFDEETQRPARMQPGGSNPILVTKDGSRVSGFWPFDPELAEYGFMPPQIDRFVVLSSASDVPATAKALRDVRSMSLSEALGLAREIASGVPCEISVEDAPSGERLIAEFQRRGVAARLDERCHVVRRKYLGRPWPMPDWMPKLLGRIRLRGDLINRYLDGRVDLIEFRDEFIALDHDLSDAEQTEAELIVVAARDEWRELRDLLYRAVLEAPILEEVDEDGYRGEVDVEAEPAFRDLMLCARTEMDDLVTRHALTAERPTPFTGDLPLGTQTLL